MKTVLFFASLIFLTACDVEKNSTPPARAEARIAMFKECMRLAATMQRQADDDVADIVSECSSQSYYMTNYIN